jgi:hypothetical protein
MVILLQLLRQDDATSAAGRVGAGPACLRLVIAARGENEGDAQQARGEEAIHWRIVHRRS